MVRKSRQGGSSFDLVQEMHWLRATKGKMFERMLTLFEGGDGKLKGKREGLPGRNIEH